jgi:hypothetical protein
VAARRSDSCKQGHASFRDKVQQVAGLSRPGNYCALHTGNTLQYRVLLQTEIDEAQAYTHVEVGIAQSV